MTLSYLMGGGVGTEPHGVELFDAFPVMRAVYAEIAEWTGLSVEQILREDLPVGQEKRQSVGTIREAALALGVHDVLAALGAPPGSIGGLSLGALTSSAIAGAIGRREFIEFLAYAGEFPDP